MTEEHWDPDFGSDDDAEGSARNRRENFAAGDSPTDFGRVSTDDILSRFEIYGSTPPRTRIKLKNREKKQKMDSAVKVRPGRLTRSRADRRNTVDCAILNQMIIEPSIDDKRTDKRSLQLQRDFDREQKATGHHKPPFQRSSLNFDDSSQEVDHEQPVRMSTVPKLIESCSRFMSVKSRPVGCRVSAPPTAFTSFKEALLPPPDSLQNRKDFHETFSNLIKLGSLDKPDRTTKMQISREEHIWQTEVKDLIWLELQAWHGDRSIEQQDKYLFTARQNVGELLRDIMNYKFHRKLFREESTSSGITIDSGLATGSTGSEPVTACQNGTANRSGFCFGCLSMYCRDCMDSQSAALKQVEILLGRLETAESLYSSSKAMGSHYPVYKSSDFVGRVKAMCLWYNITRHHRMKLLILGKLLAKLHGRQYQWPLTEAESTNSSIQESDGNDSARGSSNESKEKDDPKAKIQFQIDESELVTDSASDSANSEEISQFFPPSSEYNRLLSSLNTYKLEPLHENGKLEASPASPYRKFIENVLKSRGLGKSLSFLHRLHNVVLRKAHITLEKPGTEDTDEHDIFDDEDYPVIEPPLEKEQEDELRRFGTHSVEFKQIGLPPYTSVFIFLSLIPIEVIHEFLKMKLETKPLQPNPLSLEQLIKELKEGLTLALIHRDRFQKHIGTALFDREDEMEKYLVVIEEFEGTLKKIFELYLEYTEQWILYATPENHRKTALDEEWRFTKLLCPMITGEHALAAKTFSKIVQSLFEGIGDRLVTSADELDSHNDIFEEDATNCESTKWQLLTICRETQQLFTVEREQCVKIMAFTKSLFRDIEKVDFHRDHNEVDPELEDKGVCIRHHHNFMCEEVGETISDLKRAALKLREKLTSTIQRVQEKCDMKCISDIDDSSDKQSVLSRTREILHQGYKFGFELHKDLSRIFETKTSSCKNVQCEKHLARATIEFAQQWMRFVTERCERGRGLRPRWAAQGLEFLIAACDPTNTNFVPEKDFDVLKSQMDRCISHVIGSISEPERVKRSPRSRRLSPVPGSRAATPTRSSLSYTPTGQKALLQQLSLREKSVGLTPSPDILGSNEDLFKKTSCENVFIEVPQNYTPVLRPVRVRDAVNRLDMQQENKLREKNLIGQVKELNFCDKVVIRARSVHFSWHRGIKIGQGRFGKVYTAVNNSTGELMAMKEIPIQVGDPQAIKRVAEELKIFEGINQKNLVKYYGVEIHREELLIFMELCSEGTLESLVELSGGLHEGLTRRYTIQLLSAVEKLHENLVVHRDIKTANIFMTNDGNCLKLGDFGSAVKIQAAQTMAGELKGYVGTQAYMAPEVFTKNNSEGYGRASDIWSVGCCVIEMASGKRPWYQYDSNFQIMFKVGMGESPEMPQDLSEEGKDFVETCLDHDPKERWSAEELLLHNFCKVSIEDDCTCENDKEAKRNIRLA